jgi:hypothetical protein
MTFAYDIYPEARSISVRYEGKFTLAGLLETTARLLDDARYAPEYDGLVDLTDVGLGVEMTDLRALIGYVQAHARVSRGRWAAVTDAPLATACSLVYKRAMAPQQTFEVFSTAEAACAFLGVRGERSAGARSGTVLRRG